MSKIRSSYQLHIQLCDVRPAIWRRVVVHGGTTLARLHQIVQASMGWDNRQRYLFEIAGQRYGVPDADWPEDPTMDARRYTIGQLLQGQALPIRYLYDFGDAWLHHIRVEDCSTADASAAMPPQCLAGRNACPPENSGGALGYAGLLQALQHPGHPQHRRARRRYGNFDAALFDLQAAQQRLHAWLAREEIRSTSACKGSLCLAD